jgi:hypothetical protein
VITEDALGNLYGSDGNKLIFVPGMKATQPYIKPKKNSQSNLEDLDEEEEEK